MDLALLNRYSEEKILGLPVIVQPHLLRFNLQSVIQDILNKETKGKCTEEDGFILQLKRIININDGMLDKKTGAVHYNVRMVAQILRPSIGDIIEAVVSKLFKIGIFADLGPLSLFIPLNRIPEEIEFDKSGQFIHKHANLIIKKGTEIKMKIEKLAMLDDNFLPSNSTCCVLKGMGELIL